ncbi:STAS domain-containing protein [Paucibacter sp. DJ1R-11]|uniref:STAS domain-containing protein n=1 Tax=Paucibacter sp. DJ1R-11 TaxID=2893556 RepID=UPI0021E50C2D|nr:STAS domain-containing protein [Paucibacter sp. DJ1R-11]MCV2366155.1 STAS domain-containing protein [Paucibacter sp. DJ1R-11]
MSETQDGSAAMVWPLGPELTIAQAGEVHQKLLELLPKLQGDLGLQLAAISEFDSAGIQLLLSTRRTLQQRGARLQLLEPSAVVLAGLRCYGLDAQLEPQATADEEQAPCP